MKLLLSFVLLSSTALGFAQSADTTFDSNGVKIHYVAEGEGETIVLIHGWMSDATMWGAKPQAPEGFRVVAMDCRGHGKSDKPHDPAKYGVEMAEDVVRLLDHLKVQKAHLVGYSMGTFIAGKVAAKYPERVRSLVFGGQSPLIVGAPSSGGPSEVDIFAKAVEEGKGLGSYLLAVMPPDRPKMTLEQANALTEALYKGKDLKAWAISGQSLGALAVREEDLTKCKAPVLFVYGSKEPESLRVRVESLRKVLKSSQVSVVEGADHVSALAKPAFGAALVGFLVGNRGKG